MRTGGAAERFAAELRSLYQAAGRPTLDRLVRHCRDQSPPVRISDATVNDWLTGTAVPSGRSERALSQIVRYLREQARARGGPDPFPADWATLLTRAREEKAAKRRRPRPSPRRGPVTLPPAPSGFTGRDDALAELARRLAGTGGTVTVVTGMGGVGKTALAVHAAHAAGPRFTGGVLFLGVRGHGQGPPLDAGAAAERLLRALGVPDARLGGTGPEPVERWRSVLAGAAGPLLIVLDDVASAGQVSPLLPDPPHRMVITSRDTLSALPAHRIGLTPLDTEESVRLLDRALRRVVPADDRVTASPREARELADLCGRLPLALRIAAALLLDDPHLPVSAQAAALAEVRGRLDRLSYDDVDEQGRPLGVRAAFDLSYERLDAEQRRAFDLLGVVPGADFTAETAAAALDRTPDEAGRLLSGLTRRHLLQSRPGRRWDLHDLVRVYAAEHARADAARYRDALARLLAHYRAATTDADRRLAAPGTLRLADVDRFASRDEALSWLDAEHGNVAAAIAAAHDAELWEAAYETAVRLTRHLEFRHHTDEWTACARLAVDAAERLGPAPLHLAALSLGNAHRAAGRHEEAERELRRALALAPDPLAEGRAWHNLGLVRFNAGDHAEAVECHRRDLRVCEEAGDTLGVAEALTALGDALRMCGEHAEAADALVRAIEVFELLRDTGGLVRARANLALVLMAWNPAWYGACGVWHLCQALRLARERDDHHGETAILHDLGVAYLNLCPACHGRAAVRCAARAMAGFERQHDPVRLAHATRAYGLGLRAVGDLTGARRALDRAAAVLGPGAEDDVVARSPHVPGCYGRPGFRWLDRLPEAVIQGDFHDLDAVTWIGFRFLTREGPPASGDGQEA